jgi:hypothetical protein
MVFFSDPTNQKNKRGAKTFSEKNVGALPLWNPKRLAK